MENLIYILICFVVFMFGASLASFCGVLLHRIPKKEDFLKSRSYCPDCTKTLSWYELFPVFSFLLQGGKCRKCGVRLSPQYIIMELLCGGANLFAFMTLGFRYETLIAFILFPVLVSLSVEDIRKTEIPYWCTGTITVLGLAALVISRMPHMFPSIPWYEHLIGALVISVPFAVFCFLGAMGGGDVQLTAAAGLLLGWAIVPAVLIGMIAGGIVGAVIKLRKKQSTICFGPFLALGIAVGYIYGYDLIEWYAAVFWI